MDAFLALIIYFFILINAFKRALWELLKIKRIQFVLVLYLFINFNTYCNIYLECLKNCETCVSENKCEKCYDNYYLIEDQNSSKCVECSDLGDYNMNKNCQICENQYECKKCLPKFYIVNNSNTSECLKMEEILYYVKYDDYLHSYIIYYNTMNPEFLSMITNSSFSVNIVGFHKNIDFIYEIIENNKKSFGSFNNLQI